MKKLVSNGILLLLSVYTTAQTANPNNFQKMVDFLPPAPNAAAIIKHSDIDLNKNTGSPTINIPLFNVKGNKLSAGVSVGYSSTGIKVDEIASRAGMGWALNAGGVVTRTVRGRADELSTRITPPFADAGDNCGTYSFFENAVATYSINSGLDAEPDLFNYNMNGNGGSFVLDADLGSPILIPAGKDKVETNFSGAVWNIKITTTDGIMYYFGGTGATEKTKRNSTCGKTYDNFLANAWYLTKIEHPNGEVINLTYAPLTYSYETGVSETKHWSWFMIDYRDGPASCPSGECPAPPASSKCVNLATTQGVLLSSISNNSNTVNFTYTSRSDCTDQLLSSVTQSFNGQSSGVFNLTYNQQAANMLYSNESASGNNTTPYLTELKESSPDLVFSKTHKFIYNDPGGRPPRLSFSQDHWGYFNGRVNNTFIPKPTDIVLQQRFPTATANREPDAAFAGKGMLTKIVYPTGGIDNIDYESNDVEDVLPSYSTYHEYNCSVNGKASQTEASRTTTFTIDRPQVVELDITCSTQNPAGYDPIHMQSHVDVSSTLVNVLSESFNAGSGTQYIRYLNPSWNLAPGTYTLIYSARGASQTTTVKLKYYPQNFTPAGKNKIVGGVRVKRVSTGNPGETPVIKRYYYANMDQLDVSSSMPVPTPVYNKDYENALVCQIQTSPGGGIGSINAYCHLTAMYSGSLNNLFNYGSGAVSYGSVIESIGENFEGGAVQSKFYAGSDLRPTVWWGNEILGAPLSNWSSPLNGKPREDIVYKKPVSGPLFPIKKTLYNYTIDNNAHIKLYGYTVNKKYNIVTVVPGIPCGNNASNVGSSVINSFDAMRYDIDSRWAHLTSQTETLYDENGTNPVITTTNMFFDNIQHFQLTRLEVLNSKNETIKTSNTYPPDFPGVAVYNAMTAKNIITPVVTSKTENGTAEVSFDKINYGDAGNNNYVPVSVQKSVKGNVLEIEGTIDQYDAKGNILQFTNKTGIVSSIIWGYSSQYPVAQVAGTTYANAIAQLTGGSVTVLQTIDGTALQTELNRIRTNIPSARVTSYTYKLMAGVTSITDPNNKTNSYTYDSFNRLLTIKDQDGNVVKKNEYVYTTPAASSTPNVYFNQVLTLNYFCQTCLAGYTASPVAYTVPFGKYFSLLSQADADAQAAADVQGQEYANKTAKCISTITCPGPQYKAINCGCELGVKVCENTTNNGNGTYTVIYHYHFSDNTNSQSYFETITCSGVDKKFINCICETGVKVCDGTPVNNGNGTYTVTYHYHFSNNTNSQVITETITCSGADKKFIGCICETGVKIYTSSVLTGKFSNNGCAIGTWKCTFYYRWSDGSTSGAYTECSPTDCMDNGNGI